MDIRFILRVSVGLMVLAPSPVACEEWVTPGMIDIRFAGAALAPFAEGRGDRGAIEMWLWSTERMLVSGDSMD